MELKLNDKEIFDDKIKESMRKRGYQVDKAILKMENDQRIMTEIFNILRRENYTVRNSLKLLDELSNKIKDLGMNVNLNM